MVLERFAVVIHIPKGSQEQLYLPILHVWEVRVSIDELAADLLMDPREN